MSEDESLRDLLDREAIRTRITRFGRYLDEKRWDDYAALYTEDGVLELPFGSWTGPTAILDQVKADLSGYVVTQHVSTNHDVDIDGDSAQARVTFIATHVSSADGRAFWRGGGAYHLDFSRVHGSWFIAHIRIEPAWLEAINTEFPAHD